MPNLRSKTWTTTTPANVEDAQYWEDHLISDAVATKAANSVQSVNSTTPDANGNVDIVALPAGGTTGQVLTKQSNTSGDADWENPTSSGHTIEDAAGTTMAQQPTMQFTNAIVTNDSVNSKTIVDCKGTKGDPGQAATITVGTVTTLPAGSSATVTNSGTSSAAVFNFGIPKGADGTGAGDMLKADYDSDSAVELAGGIASYVASQAYTLPTAASNVLGGVKVGTNLSIDASGVLSATDTNTDALHDLTDVNILLPSDGQALLYNSTSGKWENGDVAGSASDITYDNTGSGLTADDVQEAIDEIDSNLDTLDGKAYKTDDSTETTIANDDLLPIYDTSATAAKKITVANVVKATVSNPNLLDNPWFTVNQRGFSSDNTLGYTVDRWKNNIGNFTVSISDDTITLTKSSDTTVSEFVQYFELSRLSACVGKYITLSVMLSDGTIYKGSGIMPTLTSSLQWFIEFSIGDNFTAGCGVRTTSNCLVRIKSNIASATLSVKAVKLEVGSISTLALDTAPNYQQELAKCQRYFVRIDNTSGGICVGNGITLNIADRVVLCIKLPISMRTKPSVVGITDVECVSGSQTISVSSIGSSSHDNGYETLNVVATGATIGTSYLVRLKSNKQLDFSADL